MASQEMPANNLIRGREPARLNGSKGGTRALSRVHLACAGAPAPPECGVAEFRPPEIRDGPFSSSLKGCLINLRGINGDDLTCAVLPWVHWSMIVKFLAIG